MVLGGGYMVPGGSAPGGAWSQGRCMVPGGVSAPGGAWSQGESAPGGGAWWRPPLPTPTATGGTHPTGMHSC